MEEGKYVSKSDFDYYRSLMDKEIRDLKARIRNLEEHTDIEPARLWY